MLSVYLLQSLKSCYMILVPAVYNAIQAIHIQCLPFIYMYVYISLHYKVHGYIQQHNVFKIL